MGLISAYVLAGGKSSRMGSDKAFLELNGRTLLERALEIAKSVAATVTIVGDVATFVAFGPVVPDVYLDHGPLGGIHSALAHSRTELNLIIAVDLPFLETGLLNYLHSQAEATDAIVTVPFIEGRYQPLCAVYRKEFGATAEAALQKGRDKIDALFAKIPLQVIDESKLEAAGFRNSAFRNVNTPEEWREAKRAFAEHAPIIMNREDADV